MFIRPFMAFRRAITGGSHGELLAFSLDKPLYALLGFIPQDGEEVPHAVLLSHVQGKVTSVEFARPKWAPRPAVSYGTEHWIEASTDQADIIPSPFDTRPAAGTLLIGESGAWLVARPMSAAYGTDAYVNLATFDMSEEPDSRRVIGVASWKLFLGSHEARRPGDAPLLTFMSAG